MLLTSGFPRAPGPGQAAEEFRHVLIKPYRKDELAAKIRAALDG